MALTDDLVSCWKLDESSGNALDAHGSNHLTEMTTIGATSGLFGGARDFESSESDYFNIASNSTLQAGNINFTLMAWAYLESKSSEMYILGKYETVGDKREYSLTYNASADRFRFVVSPDGSTGISSVYADTFGSPSTGTWYFVLAWHDPAGDTINISVNNGASDFTSHSAGVNASDSPLQIGAVGRAAAGIYWDGLLEHVALWKRLLTADDKTSLYNGGAGLAYPFGAAGSGPLLRPRLLRPKLATPKLVLV